MYRKVFFVFISFMFRIYIERHRERCAIHARRTLETYREKEEEENITTKTQYIFSQTLDFIHTGIQTFSI